MKKKQWIMGLVVLVALVALVVWGRDRIHFDFAEFRAQLAQANWWMIAIGFGCIYLGYVFRSMRWAVLLRHNLKVPLLYQGSQVASKRTGIALARLWNRPRRPYRRDPSEARREPGPFPRSGRRIARGA